MYPVLCNDEIRVRFCRDGSPEAEVIKSTMKEVCWDDILLEPCEEMFVDRFKPYDRIVVRDDDDEEWTATLFSHFDESSYYPVVTVGDSYRYALKYFGNEDLVGKKTERDCYI